MPSWTSAAVIALCSSLLVAVPASAECPANPSNGIVRACAIKATGTMRCIGPTESCKSTETLLQWNVQGPPGPQGPQGDAGPAGPPGAGLISGTIRGQLALCSGDLAGTQVFIAGQSFQVTTASSGQFQLNYVPPGTYELLISRSGTVVGRVPVVQVIVDQVTDVGTVQLTDLTTGQNCGSCGNVCATGSSCQAGTCVFSCPAGITVCGTSCKNLQTDAENCGACGAACTAGANMSPGCESGLCVDRCTIGFANCDSNFANGCEVNVRLDELNCGGCGLACDAVAQGRYTCGAVCTYPWGPWCLGYETRCLTSALTCNTGWANCNNTSADGCETSLTTRSNCGSCGNSCGSSGTCAGGFCISGPF
jgi:hypothetical protein